MMVVRNLGRRGFREEDKGFRGLARLTMPFGRGARQKILDMPAQYPYAGASLPKSLPLESRFVLSNFSNIFVV